MRCENGSWMRSRTWSERRHALANPGTDERGMVFPDNRGNVGMPSKTVTRADLTEAVYREIGLSRNESAQLVSSVLEQISGTLARGESVKISSFGTFSVRDKAQRPGRNPKTSEEVPILPRRVLVFRASHVLKDRINRLLSGSDD